MGTKQTEIDLYFSRSKIKLSGDIQENPGPKIICNIAPLSHLQRNSIFKNPTKLSSNHKNKMKHMIKPSTEKIIAYEPSKYLTTLLLITSNDVEVTLGQIITKTAKTVTKR